MLQEHKIFIKPLPELLDELEDSIKGAEEAASDAREAANEVRFELKRLREFANLIAKAQENGLNANIEAYNSKMAEWK